jgi:hypothetical protein
MIIVGVVSVVRVVDGVVHLVCVCTILRGMDVVDASIDDVVGACEGCAGLDNDAVPILPEFVEDVGGGVQFHSIDRTRPIVVVVWVKVEDAGIPFQFVRKNDVGV